MAVPAPIFHLLQTTSSKNSHTKDKGKGLPPRISTLHTSVTPANRTTTFQAKRLLKGRRLPPHDRLPAGFHAQRHHPRSHSSRNGLSSRALRHRDPTRQLGLRKQGMVMDARSCNRIQPKEFRHGKRPLHHARSSANKHASSNRSRRHFSERNLPALPVGH